MSDCPVKIDLIYDEENIGDSLTKINQNFTKILSGACLIEQQLENMVNIRTFFYYGPNAPTESEATWAFSDYSTARPAISTIELFVNNELKIPAISEVGDIALWQNNYYEVDDVLENQYFVGKDPDYSYSSDNDNFGSSISIIVNAHYTRVEKLVIEKDRL